MIRRPSSSSGLAGYCLSGSRSFHAKIFRAELELGGPRKSELELALDIAQAIIPSTNPPHLE